MGYEHSLQPTRPNFTEYPPNMCRIKCITRVTGQLRNWNTPKMVWFTPARQAKLKSRVASCKLEHDFRNPVASNRKLHFSVRLTFGRLESGSECRSISQHTRDGGALDLVWVGGIT